MSYTSADLVSAPVRTAALTTGRPIYYRHHPNPNGLTASQRERLFSSYSLSSDPSGANRRSDWDVVKENHRFIRDNEEVGDVSWEERVARAYESKLFKEFALIDLKHYKSKKLALRWRTAPEVVNGTGEDSCASLRCKYHDLPSASPPLSDRCRPSHQTSPMHPDSDSENDQRDGPREMPALQSFELPFVYVEADQRKEALVKVRLCPKCTRKLLWKPGKDKERDMGHSRSKDWHRRDLDEDDRERRGDAVHDKERHHKNGDRDTGSRRRRNAGRSRSRSPGRHGHEKERRRHDT